MGQISVSVCVKPCSHIPTQTPTLKQKYWVLLLPKEVFTCH